FLWPIVDSGKRRSTRWCWQAISHARITAWEHVDMEKITTFLWFDIQAEEAATFYVSIFTNSKVGSISRYPEGSPGPAGKVMTVEFELEGRPFVALNGGPIYKFTPAISFHVNCESQAEVDQLWSKLSKGGKEVQCGWLQDKFGVSWQIIPVQL